MMRHPAINRCRCTPRLHLRWAPCCAPLLAIGAFQTWLADPRFWGVCGLPKGLSSGRQQSGLASFRMEQVDAPHTPVGCGILTTLPLEIADTKGPGYDAPAAKPRTRVWRRFRRKAGREPPPERYACYGFDAFATSSGWTTWIPGYRVKSGPLKVTWSILRSRMLVSARSP